MFRKVEEVMCPGLDQWYGEGVNFSMNLRSTERVNLA